MQKIQIFLNNKIICYIQHSYLQNITSKILLFTDITQIYIYIEQVNEQYT